MSRGGRGFSGGGRSSGGRGGSFGGRGRGGGRGDDGPPAEICGMKLCIVMTIMIDLIVSYCRTWRVFARSRRRNGVQINKCNDSIF
jgi:hypothetical protein